MKPWDPKGYHALLKKLEETAPPWSKLPPWEAEKLLEKRRIERQRELFDKGTPEK